MTTSANSAIPTMWGYSTTDATAAVDTSGYFNGVAGQVQVGDIIMANTFNRWYFSSWVLPSFLVILVLSLTSMTL
jgi:hypothetical protein